MRNALLFASTMLLAGPFLPAQEAPAAKKPQVKINYINVCTPSEDDRKEMAAALARVPAKPAFSGDFEASRGRTTIAPNSLMLAESVLPSDAQTATGETSVSRWVRLRKDFTASQFATAQYSVSLDGKAITESFVFRLRDLKKDDIVQVAIEDTVTSADPASVVASQTPVDHVKIERFGKGSLGLRRCADADQTPSEPIFRQANELANRYRAALGVAANVPSDLRRITATTEPAARTENAHPAKKKAALKPESKAVPAESK